MNKKAIKFLGEHTVNIIISVIVILVLAVLLVKLYGLFEKEDDLKKAENQIKKLVEIVNQVKIDGKERVTEIFPPKDNWYLASFTGTKEFPIGGCREDKESCLCLCNSKDCNMKKKCVEFDSLVVVEGRFSAGYESEFDLGSVEELQICKSERIAGITIRKIEGGLIDVCT